MKRLILLLAIPLLTIVSTAQDNMPNPDTIFAEGVTVLPLPETTLPMWSHDDETLEITYYDAGTGETRTFPYPDSVEDISYVMQWNDAGLIITEPFLTTANTFVIDSATGVLSTPDTICWDYVAQVGGEWILHQDTDTGLAYLCNNRTGETSPPIQSACEFLPAVGGYDYAGYPVTAPDGNFVIFSDCNTPVTFYAYNHQTQVITRLGTVDIPPEYRIIRWLDDNTFLMHFLQFSRYGESAYVITDIRESESVEVIAQLPNSPIQYLEDEQLIIWIDFTQASETGDYYLYEYDLATRERRLLHTMPCVYCETMPTEWIDEVNRVTTYISWLVEQTTDYYIVYDELVQSWGDVRRITIYDANTFDIVYEQSADNIALGWYLREDYPQLETDTLLVAEFWFSNAVHDIYSLHLLSFDGGLQERRLEVDAASAIWGDILSPNARYILVDSSLSDAVLSLDIYDIVEDRTIPFIQAFNRTQYWIEFYWNDDYTLEIRIEDKESRQRLKWHIQIDALAGANE